MNTQISKMGRPAAMLMAMTMVLVPAPSASAITIIDCDLFPSAICGLMGTVGLSDICYENPATELLDQTSQELAGQPVCSASGFTSRAVFTLERYDSIMDGTVVNPDGTMRVMLQVIKEDGVTYEISHHRGGPAEQVSPDVWSLQFPAGKNHADFVLQVTAAQADGSQTNVALKVLPDPQGEYAPHATNSAALVSLAR